MPPDDLVSTERRGPVAVLTLNRPDKRNALSVALRRRLAGALEETGADETVAVLVITGAPPAFCAGMDRAEFGGDESHRRDLFDTSRGLYAALEALPVPAVAAVNGPALGGGFALAAGCDVRVASAAATFGHPEVSLGIPASYGFLLRVLGDPAARELAFTGRIVGAEEAMALGIVREIAGDAVGRAVEIAEEMARNGRAVLEATKRIVRESNAGGAARRAWDAELRMFHRALFPEE